MGKVFEGKQIDRQSQWQEQILNLRRATPSPSRTNPPQANNTRWLAKTRSTTNCPPQMAATSPTSPPTSSKESAHSSLAATAVSAVQLPSSMPWKAPNPQSYTWMKKEFTSPMGRPGQPSEVATCFVFLASADSSFISGQSCILMGVLLWEAR